uniref:hypothetical protein n=1 Tax=Burkholderia sp. M701 TaxID=326454 RepID=UPI0012EC84D9|nr:hypothetical protein [Burkholderia sp. M701]
MSADRYQRREHDANLAFNTPERDRFATSEIRLGPRGSSRLKVVSVGAGVRVSPATIGGTFGRQKRQTEVRYE